MDRPRFQEAVVLSDTPFIPNKEIAKEVVTIVQRLCRSPGEVYDAFPYAHPTDAEALVQVFAKDDRTYNHVDEQLNTMGYIFYGNVDITRLFSDETYEAKKVLDIFGKGNYLLDSRTISEEGQPVNSQFNMMALYLRNRQHALPFNKKKLD